MSEGVREVGPRVDPARATTADLLEREDALGRLHDALDDASRSRGSIALVTGEPGIGKTALSTAFLDEVAGGSRILAGLCDDLTTPRPLGPLRDLADLFSAPLATALRDDSAPQHVHTLLLEELRSSRAPTVLALDDVHWADQATLDAITVVGRRLTELPVLLLLTARDGELDPDHPLRVALDALQRAPTVHVELEPLSREAVAVLAGDDAETIFDATGGNPFFVSEMIAHRPGPLPPSLAHAVLGRVARLTGPVRELLELISVVPGRMPIAILDAVEPGWSETAEPAERRALLTSDTHHVRFRHELTRAAVHSSVPAGRRRLLHGRIVAALRDLGADPADMVHHAEAAGMSDVVAEHALLAARQAQRAGSCREAFAHFTRAAEFATRLDPDGQAQLWEDYAASAYLVGRCQDALSAVTRAIELYRRLGNDRSLGRCLTFRSHVHWFTGDGDNAYADAADGREVLERAGDRPGLAQGYVQSSELDMLAGRADAALRWGHLALRTADGHPGVRTRALATIGAMRIQLDPDDTEPLMDALRAADASGEHHHGVLVLTALAFVNLQWVRPEQAMSFAEQGRTYAQDHELDTMVGYLEAIRAWLLLRRGDWRDAERLALRQLTAGTAPEGTVAHLQARTVLAELAVREGSDDTDRLLPELAADAARARELKRMGPVLELAIEDALLRGRRPPVDHLAEVRRVVGPDPLAMGGAAARVAAWATICGQPHTFDGLAPHPYAAMIRGDWRAAAEAFGRAGWTYDQALMLSMLDDAEALTTSLELARGLGAAPLEGRVVDRIRRRGMSVPRGARSSTRSNPAELTDRQLEVLRLVARGHRNAEIAQQLHVSHRTVEHHVAGMLAKLGVSSRVEAVARAAELGLDDVVG